MEKIRLILVVFLFLIIAILTFTLSKSWFMFDKGIELKEDEPVALPPGEETAIKEEPKSDMLSFSKILWRDFLYYPTDLNREAGGFGPDEVLSHAKNITFINLNTGKLHRIFQKKAYIWDYFVGEFKRKTFKNNSQDPVIESIDIGNRMIVLAMTEDTNQDGFLNNRDKPKIFIYHPYEERLDSILPKDYYFEKILFNTKQNILALIIKKEPKKKEDKSGSVFFVYDVTSRRGQTVFPE